MNGRVEYNDGTPEGYLAAIVGALAIARNRKGGAEAREPDHADLKKLIRPHIRRLILLDRIEEAKAYEKMAKVRMDELARQLLETDKEIESLR